MTDLCKVIHRRRRSRPQVTGDSASGDGRLSESVRIYKRPASLSAPPSTLSLFTPTPYHLNSSGTDVFLCGGVSRISLSLYITVLGKTSCFACQPPPLTRLAASPSSPFQHRPPILHVTLYRVSMFSCYTIQIVRL